MCKNMDASINTDIHTNIHTQGHTGTNKRVLCVSMPVNQSESGQVEYTNGCWSPTNKNWVTQAQTKTHTHTHTSVKLLEVKKLQTLTLAFSGFFFFFQLYIFSCIYESQRAWICSIWIHQSELSLLSASSGYVVVPVSAAASLAHTDRDMGFL